MHLRKARALILDRFADGCGLEVHKKGNLLFSVQFLRCTYRIHSDVWQFFLLRRACSSTIFILYPKSQFPRGFARTQAVVIRTPASNQSFVRG